MDDDDDDALYAHFPDEPLQLIAVVEESGTWKLEAVEQTLSLLAQITEPLVVVAVAGPYRSGKSSLMNWLAGSRKSLGASAETATAGLGSDKFAVGHGVRRCTRGLWVWGRPRRVTLKDGSNGAAIFIDSEGTGDLDADRTYDGSIFALATLLASTLLYNSVGSIDERTISDLGFIANASLKILAGSTEDIPMDDAMLAAAAQHTTDFVWVLRDFSLDLVAENGQAIDSDDYLNIALNQRRGDASDATRVAIATFFARKRKCITLPRPAASEEELNGGLAMTPRPEFLDKLKCLATVLFERCEAKKVKAVTLRGGTFAKLARSYAGVLGPKGPMDVQSAWEAVGAAELEDAVQRALNLHATSLESAFAAPLPQETENGASSESGPSSESSSGPTESTMSAAQLRACRAAEDELRRHSDLLATAAQQRGALAKLREATDSHFFDRRQTARLKSASDLQRAMASLESETVAPTPEHHSRDADLPPPTLEEDVAAAELRLKALVCCAAVARPASRALREEKSAAKFAGLVSSVSFSAAKRVFEAHGDAQRLTTADAQRIADEARGRVAFLDANQKALQENAAEHWQKSHDELSKALILAARLAQAENKSKAHATMLAGAVQRYQTAEQELTDAAAALYQAASRQQEATTLARGSIQREATRGAVLRRVVPKRALPSSESDWQAELHQRLDDRIKLHGSDVAHLEMQLNLEKIRNRKALRRTSSAGPSILDFMNATTTSDIAIESGVDLGTLEAYLEDFDLEILLPVLKKLGASSLNDLAFIDIENDFAGVDLDAVAKRKLQRAVEQIKATYDTKQQCTVS